MYKLVPKNDEILKSLTESGRTNAKKAVYLLQNAVFDLELKRELEDKAIELLKIFYDKKPDSLISPEIILSAIIYYAAKQTQQIISRSKICKTLNVNQYTNKFNKRI